jgi:hypothetical protein
MRVQIDSFGDSGMVVLLLYPEGRGGFDVPRELLPEGSRAGDVLGVSFAHDRWETEHMASEDKCLLGELLGRNV